MALLHDRDLLLTVAVLLGSVALRAILAVVQRRRADAKIIAEVERRLQELYGDPE